MMDDSVKILNFKGAESIVNQIKSRVHNHGTTDISVFSWWSTGQRWSRNKAMLTSDQRDVRVVISHEFSGTVRATTNQLDPDSIAAVCKMINTYSDMQEPKEIFVDMIQEPVTYNSTGSEVWSDSTFNRESTDNASIVHTVSRQANSRGFFSNGYVENGASSVLKYQRDRWGREFVTSGQITQAHCSMTVREPSGNGSGWAGGSSFDMARLDPLRIAETALEKCTLSLNAVRIEPGRYQTILEPQASQFFFATLVAALDRGAESGGRGPIYLETDESLRRHRTKLGLKIVDDRISISHDPSDPLIGTHVEPQVEKVNLIENGVLKSLFSSYEHSLGELVQKEVVRRRSSFRVEGTQTPVEEMISTMKRGLVVTRVSNPIPVGMVYTGTTRDGLWLVENGKITKAVRNFRWTESPWFILNNVEQIGQSTLVFTPEDVRRSLQSSFASSLTSVICPWIKVNDFSFTSTVDAV